jgi:hypothetical protein
MIIRTSALPIRPSVAPRFRVIPSFRDSGDPPTTNLDPSTVTSTTRFRIYILLPRLNLQPRSVSSHMNVRLGIHSTARLWVDVRNAGGEDIRSRVDAYFS